MVQTRNQVRKNAQPLFPVHISLSSDDSHGFPRDDCNSPNSSQPHMSEQQGHRQVPQSHTQPHLSTHQATTQQQPLAQPHLSEQQGHQQYTQWAPVQQQPGAPAAHRQVFQLHTQPPRPTTGAALSVTHSSHSSHRGQNSNNVGTQKRPYQSPGSPTIRFEPRNSPSLSVYSSSPEQSDKKMKASKSLQVSHWITLNDIVALI
ncbi:hypothetical protein V6N11_082216 [Hibiscus sabdariffa]|uniref:Uncharacterized protein n=1 Tax=Hibiscus sabdariffa TaxID=183260 RepID=A0ABR2QHV7_9ROSI